MTSLRSVSSAVTAAVLLAASGCRTAGVDNLARQPPPHARAGETAAALLEGHNRNAERVVSLEAKPSISSANRGAVGGLSGKLALELPRNFKLELQTAIHKVADIGSNNEEFWFWTKDSQDKAVYYCNYEESGASPLAAGLQPDWIIEALGLRVIGDDEAADIKVTPGKDPGTVLLTQRQKNPKGGVFIKETVLDEATRRIREHWVYSADKTPLAHAVVNGYTPYPTSADPASTEKVYLPSKVRLEWIQQEKMALDVTLSGVKVNRPFSPERRKVLFVEPRMDGFSRINLADRAPLASGNPPASGNAPTSVRETLPAPPPRVRLNNPAPLGLDGASARPRDPASISADLLPPAYTRGVEEVVGPPIPTIDNPPPQNVQARSGWRHSLSDALAR